MALPLIEVPKYKLELPSNGQVVEYRPFLVKEQKILLMAAGSGIEEQAAAVLNVIDACTFNQLNVKKLANFDAEYIFLQIRSRSVGERVDLILTCGSCESKQNGSLDLTAAKVERVEGHTNMIELNGRFTIEMAWPTLETSMSEERDAEETFDLVVRSIRSIWDNDEKYDASDYSAAEMAEFVDRLDPQSMDKLEQFFNTLPALRHQVDWKCAACGQDNTITLSGLKSFFI